MDSPINFRKMSFMIELFLISQKSKMDARGLKLADTV